MSRYVYQLTGDDLKVDFVVKERAVVENKDVADILKELGISKALTPAQRWPRKKAAKKKTKKQKKAKKPASKKKSSNRSTSSKPKPKKKSSVRKSETSKDSVNNFWIKHVLL